MRALPGVTPAAEFYIPGSGFLQDARLRAPRNAEASDKDVEEMSTVYLVVPCYNEEAVLPETAAQLTLQLKELIRTGRADEKSRMLFVDDGSRDATWKIIAGLGETNPYVCGLKLSRNCGHQNALLAGLTAAKDLADCVISLDADLQDDVAALPEFLDRFHEGKDVVYGVRKSRRTDTAFKRGTAQSYYRLMRFLGVEIVDNHADYRLMSRRAVEALLSFGEVNLFLRGVVPLVGFASGTVYYDRHERFAGESKYPLRKMMAFAADGITSFSVAPLRLIAVIGFFVFLLSLAALVYALISKLTGNAQAGWATIVGSVWFIGGVQLLCLGVCGEYIGKIYKEAKHRPRFIVDRAMIQ